MDEAVRCRESGKAKVIVLNFSGHGHFDLAAYDAYLEKQLEDFEYPEELLKKALEDLPQFPKK